MRTENDFLGSKKIPAHVLYGIHAMRARENFPNNSPFPVEWYKSIGTVKLACYHTYTLFQEALSKKQLHNDNRFYQIKHKALTALKEAAQEVSEGQHFQYFIVPGIQGGAGTSINMNVNEIIANRALQILGFEPGMYQEIDPVTDANIYQSTNDVIPSSLKIAAIQQLQVLEKAINQLRKQLEHLEAKYRHTLRVAYTQMQAAVPSTFGHLFSAYNDALSRDWWRVSKSHERLKTLNMGGGAIGTSVAIPRFFVMEICNQIQRLTQLPVNRAENLMDVTQNTDVFVEVHGNLKSLAVTIEKIAGDIRLLASDVVHQPLVRLPNKQAGSSIMPGKVNPVIAEYVISVAQQVYANDTLITNFAARGCLDLNAYIPGIGVALLNSADLLASACNTLNDNLFSDLHIDSSISEERVYKNPSVCTLLNPYIGYHKAAELARLMKAENISVQEANIHLQLIDNEKLNDILKPENMLKSGFSVQDIL